jgi:hypothetical protein
MKYYFVILILFIILISISNCDFDTKWQGNHASINISNSKNKNVFEKKLYINKSTFILNSNTYSVNEIWIEKVWGYNEDMEEYIYDTRFQIIFTINDFSYNDILNKFKILINNQEVYWTSSGIHFYIDSIPQNKFRINFNNEDSIIVIP